MIDIKLASCFIYNFSVFDAATRAPVKARPMQLTPTLSHSLRVLRGLCGQSLHRLLPPIAIASVIATILIATIAIGTVHADTAKLDNSNFDTAAGEADLEAMLSELDTIKKRLNKDIAKHNDIDQAYRKTEIKIGQLAADRHRSRAQQTELTRELGALQREQRGLQRKLEQQQAVMGEHIRQAYQLGNQSAVQLFLEQQSPEDIDRQLTYLDYVNQARAQQIREYAATVKQKQQLGERIEQQNAALEDTRLALARQQQALDKLQKKRAAQLGKLSDRIKGDESRIALLHTDSKALQQLLDEVSQLLAEQVSRAKQQQAQRQAEQAAKPDKRSRDPAEAYTLSDGDFAKAKGRLPWPVNGKQHFRFGKHRPGSDVSWQGVTIAASAGEPVKAIYPGRVIFADWFQGQGLLMIVDHGDGYMSLYGHNESLLREAGAWVVGGEIIATVGNSGGQSLAALYFEIRHNGAPSDPNRWCSKG